MQREGKAIILHLSGEGVMTGNANDDFKSGMQLLLRTRNCFPTDTTTKGSFHGTSISIFQHGEGTTPFIFDPPPTNRNIGLQPPVT